MPRFPFLLAAFLVPVAAAHADQKQLHEVRADLDLEAGNPSSQSNLDVQYTFTPSGIDRRDEVVPPLRRFVRHPSAAWLRGSYDGSFRGSAASARGGGIAYLLQGRAHAQGEIGIERVTIDYDAHEEGFISAPLRAELGARPFPLVAVAAHVRWNPVLDALSSSNRSPAERSGAEREVGATLTTAIPGDRLLFSAGVGRNEIDWTFSGFHPGSVTASGIRASTITSIQASPTLSFQLSLAWRREDWDNRRTGEQEDGFMKGSLSRRVHGIQGDLGVTFWFRGRLAFRAALGGGFENPPPIYYRETGLDKDRPFLKLRLGLTKRY
ncbi:MAG: hypothetical protein HY698_18735 [Deltaproteobacteria bacterium]|nr:hypothetical protein [Deltaproteobacteria bacterium]